MNRLSKHDVNKLSVAKLLELLPVELTNDGVVVALIQDVNKLNNNVKANYDVNKVNVPGNRVVNDLSTHFKPVSKTAGKHSNK